jgi:hypothetical protein
MGSTPSARRARADIAAFAWLFSAHPATEWVYLVGSDKVAAYGQKGEQALIEQTLGRPQVNARVLYFERSIGALDAETCIVPYPWLLSRWQSGSLGPSNLSSGDLSASAVRTALAHDLEEVGGIRIADCVPPRVLAHIRSNEPLLQSYRRAVGNAADGR